MYQIDVELELRAPTCIAQRPTAPGQLTETLNYLTGTVVRGGLATTWLRGRRYEELGSNEQQQFRQIFLNDDIVFNNAWPYPSNAYRTWVVPHTAWTPKNNSGWRSKDKGGVRDVLFALLRGDDTSSGEWEGWDRLGQDFASVRLDEWSGIEIHRRLITRTALNRNKPDLSSVNRGVVVEGQLYSFEALETGQKFRATIRGPEKLLKALQDAMAQPNLMFAIGQGRSRGMGQVHAHLTSPNEAESRYSKQQLLLKDACGFSQSAGATSGQLYLPITLESDVILRDNYLLPCSSANPLETIWRYLPPDATIRNTMCLYDAVQSTRWLGGWDELRRIPRATQLAIAMGSVWVYTVPEQVALDAIAWWLKAELQGIGERRNEGYGRVRLLHPLHTKDQKL